jgi:hypothetical protein
MTMPLWRELAVTSGFLRESAMLNVIKGTLIVGFALRGKKLVSLKEAQSEL